MRKRIDEIKKFSEFLNEKSNYDDTYWTTKDGKLTIYELQEYLKDSPIIDICVSEIRDKCIHLDKSDEETKIRSEKSNLKYPIIIVKSNNEYGMILDGHHRLKKVINNNLPTIKAKVLCLDDAPPLYKELFK